MLTLGAMVSSAAAAVTSDVIGHESRCRVSPHARAASASSRVPPPRRRAIPAVR